MLSLLVLLNTNLNKIKLSLYFASFHNIRTNLATESNDGHIGTGIKYIRGSEQFSHD